MRRCPVKRAWGICICMCEMYARLLIVCNGFSILFDEDLDWLIGDAAGAGKHLRDKYQLGKGRCAQRQ